MKSLKKYSPAILLAGTGLLALSVSAQPAATDTPAAPSAASATTPPAATSAATTAPAASGRRGGARGAGRGGAAPAANNNDAFYKLGPDSQPMTGVPKGHFVGPTVLPSQVFPGNSSTYWVYVPTQYDPAKPTPIMIFNDGQAFMKEPGDIQAQNVLDNLIWRHEIPVMLGIFIDPAHTPDEQEPPNARGDWGDSFTRRPEEYNPPTDIYARVVCDELMPVLKKDYNISPDPDLHGICGASSGGCAAFAVAWFRPNDFHKVITIVGSFTDIKGEYVYPELVAAADKKPIRIFMQDGRNDNRTPGRPNNDWFLQNVRLMDALTKKGYEVNYAWGMNNHGQKMGGAILPDMLRWLWRDQAVDTDPNDKVERAFRPAIATAASTAATTPAASTVPAPTATP